MGGWGWGDGAWPITLTLITYARYACIPPTHALWTVSATGCAVPSLDCAPPRLGDAHNLMSSLITHGLTCGLTYGLTHDLTWRYIWPHSVPVLLHMSVMHASLPFMPYGLSCL